MQRFAWFLAVVTTSACDGESSDAKLVQLAIGDGSEVVVDLACVGGSGSAGEQNTDGCGRAPVHIVYQAPNRPDDAVLEFSQYRIDYEVAGVTDSAPYYAGELDVNIRPNGTVDLELPIAGLRQRAFLAEYLTAGETHGTATITLAGYDVLDKVALVEAEFEIRFVAGGTEGSHAP